MFLFHRIQFLVGLLFRNRKPQAEIKHLKLDIDHFKQLGREWTLHPIDHRAMNVLTGTDGVLHVVVAFKEILQTFLSGFRVDIIYMFIACLIC